MKQKNNIKTLIVIVLCLLSIPLIGMQFSNEIDWNILDFIAAAVLLFSTGFGINYILGKFKNTKQRFYLISLTLMLLFIIWVQLAIGLF